MIQSNKYLMNVKNLLKNENEFLKVQYEELKHKSPTSLKISLKQIRNASHMSLKDELIMENRMVQRCVEIGDFFEGVRAMLVDKDRKPNGNPIIFKMLMKLELIYFLKI